MTTEQQQRERALTDRVLASFDHTPSPRLRELLHGLVEHLHAYIRDVRLSQREWQAAIEFLTAVGDITHDKRKEFILLSDVLGASMQVVTVNNEAADRAVEATEATVLGPFYVDTSPQIELGGDIAGDATGQPCWVEGRVTDTGGHPIPRARIDVWEADDKGFYDVQLPGGQSGGRAYLYADEEGYYRFWGLTPTPYPIPHDGPVGALLAAVNRSPMRAPHLHFMVSADGKRTLITHIFVRGDELIDHDSVFGVRESLVKDFAVQPTGTPTPDGRDLGERDWARAHFDIVLANADTPPRQENEA